MEAQPAAIDARISVWFWIALLLQLATGPFYLAAGLVVPTVPLLILWAIWVVLTVMLVRWRRRGPLLLLVPVAAVAIWFGYASLGEIIFGWTA